QSLRTLREKLGSKKPRVVMQWLPMKHNEHELPRLRETAKQWGADAVEIKTTQIYTDEQAAKFLPEIEELRRYEWKGRKWETKRRYQSCRRLWFSTMIDWNGTVVACCFDKDEDFPLGNALAQDFGEIWRGKTYNRMRHMLLTQGRALDMCRNCTEGLSSYYLTLDLAERLSLPAHKRTAGLEEPPVQVASLNDPDTRAGRD
ncbi:SPASM domain-containing protein, partial [bacterium]|nr:SPASM domain-containing protein [bacterium]